MDYMKLHDAAKYLCVSTSTLYKMTHRKEIPFYKMGSRNLFKQTDLDNFLEERRVLSTAELQDLAEKNLKGFSKGIAGNIQIKNIKLKP